jgi:hypothetical protein
MTSPALHERLAGIESFNTSATDNHGFEQLADQASYWPRSTTRTRSAPSKRRRTQAPRRPADEPYRNLDPPMEVAWLSSLGSRTRRPSSRPRGPPCHPGTELLSRGSRHWRYVLKRTVQRSEHTAGIGLLAVHSSPARTAVEHLPSSPSRTHSPTPCATAVQIAKGSTPSPCQRVRPKPIARQTGPVARRP